MRPSSSTAVYYSIRFDDGRKPCGFSAPSRYADGRNEPSFRNAGGSRNHGRDTANAVYYFIATGIKVTRARTRFLGLVCACVMSTICGRARAKRRGNYTAILFFYGLDLNP